MRNVIPKPLEVLIPAVTMFAEAPSNVPFPPRHAPKERALWILKSEEREVSRVGIQISIQQAQDG